MGCDPDEIGGTYSLTTQLSVSADNCISLSLSLSFSCDRYKLLSCERFVTVCHGSKSNPNVCFSALWRIPISRAPCRRRLSEPSSRFRPCREWRAMSGVEVNAMLEKCKELDQLRDEQEKVFQEINKIHKKLQTNPEIVEKSGDAILGRLKNLYCDAKDLCESEISASTTLMNQIDCLIQSGVSSVQRKKIDITERKKRMKPDSDNSRFPTAPSIRSQLELAANLKGEQVAARVSSDDAEKDEWFVVKVINFDKDTKEFEVLDEEPGDDEESTQQRKYKLPASHIIPFPKKNDPSSAPEFQPGKHVLAVYPSTTALYKATVVNSHRKRKTDDYLLEFDDDEEDGSLPQRSVAFYKVVPLPDGHRQ